MTQTISPLTSKQTAQLNFPIVTWYRSPAQSTARVAVYPDTFTLADVKDRHV